jgi:hypothetical protein
LTENARATPRLLRVTAWTGVILMVVLAFGAASPQFHAWFHAEAHAAAAAAYHEHEHSSPEATSSPPANPANPANPARSPALPAPPAPPADSGSASSVPEDDDGCVITIFAHGVVSLSAALVLLAGIAVLKPAHRVACDRIAPAAPRYTWLRTHAPPPAA